MEALCISDIMGGWESLDASRKSEGTFLGIINIMIIHTPQPRSRLREPEDNKTYSIFDSMLAVSLGVSEREFDLHARVSW